MSASKYLPQHCETMLKVMKNGGEKLNVCSILNICENTFDNWRKEYPEFNEAYQLGKAHTGAFWDNLIKSGACGEIKGFNATAAIAHQNHYHHWTNNHHSSNTINIGNINVLELSDDELQRRIEMKAEQYLPHPVEVIDG